MILNTAVLDNPAFGLEHLNVNLKTAYKILNMEFNYLKHIRLHTLKFNLAVL